MKKQAFTLFLIIALAPIWLFKTDCQAADAVVVNHLNWDPSGVDQSVLDQVRTKKIMFGHRSTGYNIVSGLEALASNNPTRYSFNFVDATVNMDDGTTTNRNLTAGELWHWVLYRNEFPLIKIDKFKEKMNSAQENGALYGDSVDIAFLKLCFTDMDGNCQGASGVCTPQEVFDHYRNTMESLASQFPNAKFIWMTVPLKTECGQTWMYNDAKKRHDFNKLIREYIATNGGYLFDIADIESYGRDGNQAMCSDVPIMHTDWDSDGGHLDVNGQERMALALWKLWALMMQQTQANQPPTASASASTTTGTSPLIVNFTGSGTDPDGTIISYNWDFGDGTTSSLQNPSHQYSQAGTYTSTLTVTDDSGAQDTDTVVITVYDQTNTYFVSTDGSDSTGDGSKLNPFRTVNYAITTASSGSTIYIMPGTYDLSVESGGYININKTNLTVTASDVNNRPILNVPPSSERGIYIRSTGAGATVSYLVLDHGGPYNQWKSLIEIANTSGVTVDHCETRNSYHGIIIRDSKSITISNCISHDNGYNNGSPEDGNGHGFVVFNTDSVQPSGWTEKILFKNCEAYNNGGDGFQSSSSLENRRYSSYLEFDGVNFHHNREDAFDFKDSSYAIIHNSSLHHNAGNGIVTHSNLPTSYCNVYNNRIYDNGWWGAIITDNCNRWKFYNNLLYNNAFDQTTYNPIGLLIKTADSEAYFNVLYNNTRGGYSGVATFMNNALYNNGYGVRGNIDASASGQISHNYVYPTSPGQTGSNAVMDANPYFMDTANADFRIATESPLRDMAQDVGIDFDFNGSARPYGLAPDIGAFEWSASKSASLPIPTVLSIKIQ